MKPKLNQYKPPTFKRVKSGFVKVTEIKNKWLGKKPIEPDIYSDESLS